MVDIVGKLINEGTYLVDHDGRKYLVIEKEKILFAKSLFWDPGCGEYRLYKERILRNGFKAVDW